MAFTPYSVTKNAFSIFGAIQDAIRPSQTSTPDSAAAALPTSSAASTQIGSGPDTLVLKVTQDAYQGDAQYAVYVDGKQVGGTVTAKALHNSGQSDTLEIKGDWGVGNHNVSVKLLNDLYDGTPATDRNVYVEGATYNGAVVAGSSLYVNSPSSKGFIVADTGTIPLPATGVKLTKTTAPITTTHDGQVIENLDIWVDNGDALTIRHDNVVVQNVRIHHRTGDGISVDFADNVKIQNVEVINSDPPAGQDPETSPEIRNIAVDGSHGLQIDHVTVRDGSTGIFVLSSPGTHISHVDGYNFRGPMPRGQFVQFDKSGESTLTDFYTFHDKDHSHPEEAINVFMSPNVHIANGVIDGNNAPSGNGIMFEFGSTGGRVNNVDAMHMGNGAFSAYASDVVFDDTRTFDSIWGDQGLGRSVSNGLQWNIAAADVHILHSTYTRPGNPGNIVWDDRIAAEVDVREDPGATPMAPLINHYDWVV
jgi:Ca-dependent carbohydrate-binding module xylan-binding